ncbi:peptide/nickel transport system substrate-binding protein [Clostridiales Family XIII bacterium PM5-7]
MKTKKILALFMVVTLLFTAAACGGGDSGGEAKDSLTIGIDSDAVALDPLRVNDTLTMSILTNVYEPLVRMNNDSEIVPALATEWKVSDDGLDYTFTIRTDATFHNGDPITVEDVKYSLEAAVESSYTGPYMNFIDKVEIVDESTVKVTLQYAYAPFLALCTTYSQIVKEDFYKEGGEVDMAKNPVGSGPYKFKSWAQGDKLEFEAYEGYYKEAPAIKNLTYKIIPNSSTATMALESGEIDVSQNVATTDIKAMEDKEGIEILTDPSSAFYFIGMNTNVKELSDVRVRQAISKCINKQNLIDGALDGYGVPTNTFIAEGVLGYDADFNPLPYDVEEAKKLMKDAGYPDGFDLTISIPESRSTHAQIIKSDLKAIGIELTINIIETGKFWEDLENLDYEMMIMGWSYMVMDPDVGYYSLYKKDDMAGNYTGFGDAETDKLLADGRIERDDAKRAEIYSKLETIYQTAAPYVPLYWRVDAVAYNDSLTGVEIPPCGFYFVYDYAWK